MKVIRVAVIDDHSVVRMGLKFTVRLFKDLEFVGEHGGGEGAAEFVARVKPDVTLLDIRMPGKDGIAALGEILAADPDAKVVMLTTSGTDEDIYRSLEIGARGYVFKTEAADDIVAAIRAVAAGERYIPEPVRVIYERRAAAPTFSDKEIETLRLAAAGRTNREIAEELEVSEITVKVRISGVFAKLGARDRVDAVNRAVERGLIPPRA
ncbi:MAG: response regulator transcription factor [Kiritimatiellae bacterium]|nr:response regulator transcription factor [Kiritimatiellia bacterium]